MFKKNKEKRYSKNEFQSLILKIFYNSNNKQLNYKQISGMLKISQKQDRRLVLEALESLKYNEQIIELQKGKFKIKTTGSYITGKFTTSKSGAAFVISEELNEPVMVSSKNMNTAMNGDKVKVFVYAKMKSKIVEGEVIEVLERAQTTFVGTIQLQKYYAFLNPNNKKMPFDIYIPIEDLNGAKDGQKAIARITRWDAGKRNPFGEIIEILGKPGENDVEINSIVIDYGFSPTFSNEVLNEADNIPVVISPQEIARRRDFRNITTFTIDPEDAKDFDDAISYRKLNNGHCEIGVHIADVSHYVPENSILDKEAYKRGTSVYLVDRVIPMLPEKLSNEVCSLRADEDKLCFSAVFEMDDNGNIFNQWFGKTIIRSDKRFTYDEAQSLIDASENSDLPFLQEIHCLHKIAEKLKAKRISDGSIIFDSEEVKFRLDENKKPVGVYTKKMKDSNYLVEDFMLLANRSVAAYICKLQGKKVPFVYRAHDPPPKENLRTFSQFIKKFGYKINTATNKTTTNSINQLLLSVSGKKEDHLIQSLAVKAMAKAIYTTETPSHYGLGFDHYTHFTSPIRRYPDVMVHRLLYNYLNGNVASNQEKLEQKCKHSSEQERKAVSAERESTKFKQAEYLQNHIGKIFDGIISGISTWGIFVELVENKCEGLIRLKDIDDDFYKVDEANYCMVGMRTKKKYQLGDPVKIKIKSIDMVKRYIDFAIV